MAILECRELTKYFDSSLALDHVSLTVEPGRIVGLLGPNGSGKSTLIKLANGLLVPSSGVVTIDGHAPGPETKELVSYLPERTYLSGWMTWCSCWTFSAISIRISTGTPPSIC